jgi:hypothetical protein
VVIPRLRAFQIGQVIGRKGRSRIAPRRHADDGRAVDPDGRDCPDSLWADLTNRTVWIAVASTRRSAGSVSRRLLKVTRRSPAAGARYKMGLQVACRDRRRPAVVVAGEHQPLQHAADSSRSSSS